MAQPRMQGAHGYVPQSYSNLHPIVVPVREQITDAELDSQAAFVQLRNTFRRIDNVDNGILNHRQTIHDACDP